MQKILQNTHLVSFPLFKKNPLDTHSSDNQNIIKVNVLSNRLVCAIDREDTICSVPGKRMTPAAVTIPTQEHFSFFFLTVHD